MKIETHEKVYADALFEWGVDGSRMAFFEEAGELMTSISHNIRGRCNRIAVLEEIVDLQQMLNVLLLLYDDGEYEGIFEEKLARLQGRRKK